MEFVIGFVLRDAGFALSAAGTLLLACGFAGFVFTLIRMRLRERTEPDILVLRNEIVGADDLLARIPQAPAPHGGLDT